MDDLSPRQREVLSFIRRFIQDHSYPPSLRDISAALGISGNRAVLSHLAALEGAGYIRREPGSSRGITLREIDAPLVSVPVVGTVRAGEPTLAVEDIEGYVPMDRLSLSGGEFFLRVRGDSMINDAIIDGDLALVRPQPVAENGDLVVAMVEGEATLKRFYRERDHIRLQPRNPNMDPIIIPADREVTIIGKVVRILREME
ncbi:MAG: transcriptional repressor LexA [Desulfuromonadia bacterium]